MAGGILRLSDRFGLDTNKPSEDMSVKEKEMVNLTVCGLSNVSGYSASEKYCKKDLLLTVGKDLIPIRTPIIIEHDFDHDGVKESIHVCSNILFSHLSNLYFYGHNGDECDGGTFTELCPLDAPIRVYAVDSNKDGIDDLVFETEKGFGHSLDIYHGVVLAPAKP